MIKPPIPANEMERLASLRSYNIMDSLSELDYDNITKIAFEICNMPVAMITFMGKERQYFKSSIGVDLTENQRDFTFCGHGMEVPDVPLVVNDATKDPRFSGNPLVTGDYHVRFYAGVQLVNEEGFPLGTLCVFDVKENEISRTQLETLQILANQVVRLLDLRKAVSQLEYTKKGLLRAVENLKEFDYIVSHDIKAPLRGIKLLAEAISEDCADKLDESGKKYLELMNTSANDAIYFVDGVLNYSKEMHHIETQYESVNLNSLLENIIKQSQCPEHIKMELVDKLPILNSLKIGLRQVFTNLISNAIKYHDKNEGWIKINYSEDDKMHTFQVADNGMGIPKEKVDSIFTLFYMVGNENERHKKGSGVGLSIVKKRVAELGGEIKVSSVLGEGSVFEFYIPKLELGAT